MRRTCAFHCRALFALCALCALLTPRLVLGQEPIPEDQGPAPVENQGAAARSAPDLFGPALMMGLGGGAFVAGLVVHLLGIADRNAVENAPVGTPWDEVADRAARAPALIGVGQLVMGAGLVILVGGTTWLALALFDNPAGDDDGDEASTAERTLHLEVGLSGATLRGRF